MAVEAASIFRYKVALPTDLAQFLPRKEKGVRLTTNSKQKGAVTTGLQTNVSYLISRQSSSRRVIVLTIEPSWTSVSSQILLNGTPRAYIHEMTKEAQISVC